MAALPLLLWHILVLFVSLHPLIGDCLLVILLNIHLALVLVIRQGAFLSEFDPTDSTIRGLFVESPSFLALGEIVIVANY